MQGYFFETEHPDDCALTFAYIWREEDDASTSPPVKEFHSDLEGAEGEKAVTKKAVKWIAEHGEQV